VRYARANRVSSALEQLTLGERIALAKGSRGNIDNKFGTKANVLQVLRRELQGEGGWTCADECAPRKTICGGSAASRLTDAVSGFGDGLGEAGGAQTHALRPAQLPTGITSSGSNSITVSGPSTGDILSKTLAGTSVGFQNGADNYQRTNVASFQGSNSIAVTSNNTSDQAHANAQPTIITNCALFAGA
jgi:hypothetical protein